MTRAIRLWGAMLVAIVLTVSACGGDADLTAQTWTLVEVNGVPAVADGIATLTFEDGALTGNGGCNNFQTTYAIDGSSMTVTSPIAATMMACSPDVTQQETAVFGALENTETYSISGSELELIGASGNTLATYTSES